ncbi:hypothetical protein CRYUN_Cryun13aG0138800 [Craigia yunnanensis]
MAVLTALTRSRGQHCLKRSKPSIFPQNFPSHNSRFQTLGTLILEPSLSESVNLTVSPTPIPVNLDRPEAKNAIGNDMLRGLRHAFEAIDRDSSAHVVMISSSVPKVLCVGADLKERKKMTASEVHSYVNYLRSTFSLNRVQELQVHTIAVIEGAALGGGLEMAVSCDLRICGEDALLGLPETGLAIIPGAGGTQRLPRLIGKSRAKELIFTGRRIGGRDAMTMGLVNYCVPAGEAHPKALEIAREINQKGPIAIRIAKRAITEGLERVFGFGYRRRVL